MPPRYMPDFFRQAAKAAADFHYATPLSLLACHVCHAKRADADAVIAAFY